MPYAQAAPSLIGETIDGRYKIIKKLGEGGMGEVYAAEHVHIDKRFAIKLLKSEIVSNQEAVTRFQQEARSSSSIKHRNIIAIEDFGKLHDGRIYMCMELLNGQALNDLIQSPQPVDRLLNILIQTGHGLAAAHARNIVHRDMKPENIFVTFQGNEDIPKILDFGIAKVAGNDGQNNLTRTGTIFGTPFYMAPEQALGNPVDARTDVYAMGIILYEVFAGSLPFQGESFMGILTQHITTEPEPVAQRAAKANRPLPMGLADIIMRCIQKDPNVRYRTMDELVNALIQIYRGVAGAGMSTYMEAFPHAQQNTPGPMTAPHLVGGAPLGHGAPINSGGHQVQPSGGHAFQPSPSQSAPAVPLSSSSSGLYDPSGSNVAPKKKSSMGLIIAIFAVLAVGGIVAAVVIMSQKEEAGTTDGSGSGSQIADTGSDKGSDKGSATVITNGSGTSKGSDTGSAAVATNGSGTSKGSDAVSSGSGSDSGSGDTAGSGTDSGSNTVATNGSGAGSDSGSAATVQIDAGVVAPKTSQVSLVAMGGLKSYDVYVGGELVPLVDLTDHVVEVPEGETLEVTIKAKGYEDKTFKIPSKKRVFQFTLKKIKVANPNPLPNPNPTNPPPTVKCTGTPSDLSRSAPKGCREKFCATHTDAKSQAMCDAD